MASETLIRTALQLAKQLGANTSKFMGTKSNVSFLGSGPKDGMLFQQSINPESFATIGIKKVLTQNHLQLLVLKKLFQISSLL